MKICMCIKCMCIHNGRGIPSINEWEMIFLMWVRSSTLRGWHVGIRENMWLGVTLPFTYEAEKQKAWGGISIRTSCVCMWMRRGQRETERKCVQERKRERGKEGVVKVDKENFLARTWLHPDRRWESKFLYTLKFLVIRITELLETTLSLPLDLSPHMSHMGRIIIIT